MTFPNQDCQPAARDYLMDCIAGSAMARERGVTEGTHQKQDCSWHNWLAFLRRIEHHNDPYLETIDELGQLRIFRCFHAFSAKR